MLTEKPQTKKCDSDLWKICTEYSRKSMKKKGNNKIVIAIKVKSLASRHTAINIQRNILSLQSH